MYNAVSCPVSMLLFLQKAPPFGLETDAPSSREATAMARAPRPNSRREQRCRSRLLDSTMDTDPTREHTDLVLARGRAPPRRGLRTATFALAAASRAARRPPRQPPRAAQQAASGAGKLRRGRRTGEVCLDHREPHGRVPPCLPQAAQARSTAPPQPPRATRVILASFLSRVSCCPILASFLLLIVVVHGYYYIQIPFSVNRYAKFF